MTKGKMVGLDLVAIEKPRIDIAKCYSGKVIPPIDQVRIMDPDSFEDFIAEWLYGSHKNYRQIFHLGGAGDKGRDVIGVYASGDVDYYQCKHYEKALEPKTIKHEIAKLLYFTSKRECRVPLNYYFIAANDFSPNSYELLDNMNKLKDVVISDWDSISKGIIANKKIVIDKALEDYIRQFDFGIFQPLSIENIVNEHLKTPYAKYRFGDFESVQRPASILPDEIDDDLELEYINELLKAYSDKLKVHVNTIDELMNISKSLYEHFKRQRRDFYAIESISRYVRDSFTDEDSVYRLKSDIYNGVIDICEDEYEDGYERLKSVLTHAPLVLTSSPLEKKLNWIGSSEKKGTCHVLANEGTLKWVIDE